MTSPDAAIRLRIALRDLVAYWPEMVPDALPGQRLGSVGRGTPQREPHLHALSLRREAVEILNPWARLVLEERGIVARIDGSDAAAMARFLDTHADWLGDHEAGEDAADEIETIARKVHGCARPQVREQVRFIGYCTACAGRLDVTREQISVICPHCEVEHQVHDIREDSLDVVRDVLVTAREAEKLGASLDRPVEVKAATVRQWTKRGRVEALACDLEGRALRYRFGDVEQLANRGIGA